MILKILCKHSFSEKHTERVEGVSVAVPQIMNKGIPARLKELEAKYGKLDWRVAFTISLEIAKNKFVEFKTQNEAMEAGIRID